MQYASQITDICMPGMGGCDLSAAFLNLARAYGVKSVLLEAVRQLAKPEALLANASGLHFLNAA